MQLLNKKVFLGNPYHGLVTDGVLLLPNGQKISYPHLTSGDTQLVAIPNYPSVNRMVEQQKVDELHGLEWRNYAIVSDNHLGAANLGLDWLLYIDANQVVWYLKLDYHISGNQCFMSCTLQSVFGRFNTNYKTVSRVLAQEETQFDLAGKLKPLNRFTFERKHDGTEVLIHVYAKLDGENTIEFPEVMSLVEVWKIELKGKGLLSFDESIGNGITATITKHLSYEAIQSSYIRNIPKREKRFRLSKVNIQGRYDPKPVVPPECASNTYHESFDLALIPEGEDFNPFKHDQNTYLQSDWYGSEEIKNVTVRILYDKEGVAHILGIQHVTKRQNKLHQSFSGHGTGTQGPFNYYFNGFSCVVNGYGPGLIEQYDGLQTVKAHFRIIHEANLLLDGQVVNTASLAGEITQIAETVVDQPVVDSMNVLVKLNNCIVRNVTTRPAKISNLVMADPFSNILPNDDINGIFAKFHCGFISNNLLAQFVTRYISSKSKSILRREFFSACSVKPVYHEVVDIGDVFIHGSLQPEYNEIILNVRQPQCWV